MSETSKSSFFRSMYIVNAKGSGVGEKRGAWSFTVDAAIYTFAPIDSERYGAMASVCHSLSAWIIDEFRFHDTTYDTMGSEIDARVSKEDSVGLGFYYCQLDVEDITMAKGDYRSRQDLYAINADMLTQSCKRGSYSVRNRQILPRVALDIRVHISEIIRKAISEGIKRWFAGVVRR